MQERTRTGIEMGAIFGVITFMLGIAFNAGIQYANISDIRSHQNLQDSQIKDLRDAQTAIPQRLTRIEVLLEQVKERTSAQQASTP